jgi:hypothetical protein
MRLRRNLYSIRFANSNPPSVVKKAMRLTFPNNDGDDAVLKMDSHSYMVYSSQSQKDINLMIGINLVDDIDDFSIMKLDYDAAMSIFTDRLDTIEFLKMIKQDVFDESVPPSQKEVDDILDKLSRDSFGQISDEERRRLDAF